MFILIVSLNIKILKNSYTILLLIARKSSGAVVRPGFWEEDLSFSNTCRHFGLHQRWGNTPSSCFSLQDCERMIMHVSGFESHVNLSK